MAVTGDTLYTLVGRLNANRPGLGGERARALINDAIRQAIGKRSYWVDLRRVTNLAVPNQTSAGSVSTSTGSAIVTGTGTTWPMNDVVNTTLAAPITELGPQEFYLASMNGVTADSILLVNPGQINQEVVACTRVGNNLFGPNPIKGMFTKVHNVGEPVWQSSLVQQQFTTSESNPVFTITAVLAPTMLVIDNPWNGPPLSQFAYVILKSLYTISTGIRKIVLAIDQRQGIPLNTMKTQQDLAMNDPQRSQGGDPLWLASAFPNLNGNFQWEVWPAPQNQRQINVLYSLQWPALVNDEDPPPYFLEPTIFTDWASADALRMKLGPQDPYQDVRLADTYERKALQKIEDAYSLDEDRAIQDLINEYGINGIPGANADFWLSRSPESLAWEF